MNSRSYIVAFAGFFVALSIAVLTVNYFVDPYLMTGAARISSFNQYKVDISNYVRTSKKYHPLQRTHDVLLVGNSRIEMGLAPSHVCFTRADQRVYNLGLPGASVSLQLAFASNIILQQPIREVYLSLDFSDFAMNSDIPPTASSAPQKNFPGSLQYYPDGSRNPDFRRIRLLDYYQALYSLDSLSSSLKTVLLQSVATADRDDQGFNPAYDFRLAALVEGPGALFEQKMASLGRSYSKPHYIRYSNGRLAPSFDSLTEFLERAQASDIRVTLFTNPFHAQYWEMIRDKGLQDAYDDWLSSLIGLLRQLDDTRFELWDFASDSDFIHETVPATGIKTDPLHWFWEPSHYRKELGDLMLDAMLAESCGTAIVFGERRYPD
jgi:hypothetical protein